MICLLLSPIIFGAEKPHSFTPKWPRLVRHEGCRTTRGELPRGHKCCGTDERDVGDESQPFGSAGSAPKSRNHCLTPQLRHRVALILDAVGTVEDPMRGQHMPRRLAWH